jgi:hypothetical protein
MFGGRIVEGEIEGRLTMWYWWVLGGLGLVGFICFMNMFGEQIYVNFYWWNEARKERNGFRKRQQALRKAGLLKDVQEEQVGQASDGK